MKSLEQKFNGELFFFVKKRTTIGSQENGKDTPIYVSATHVGDRSSSLELSWVSYIMLLFISLNSYKCSYEIKRNLLKQNW